jgi:hypothetical protein
MTRSTSEILNVLPSSSQHEFIDIVDPRPPRKPQQPCVILKKPRGRKAQSVIDVTQDQSELLDFRKVLSGFSISTVKSKARPVVDREAAAVRRKEAVAKRKRDREAAAAAKARLPKRAKTITELAVRLHEGLPAEPCSISKENSRIVDYFTPVKPATHRSGQVKSTAPITKSRKAVRAKRPILLEPVQLILAYKLQHFTYATLPNRPVAHPLFISHLHGVCRNLWAVSSQNDDASAQDLLSPKSTPRAESPELEFACTQDYLSHLVNDDDMSFRASQTLRDFPVEPTTEKDACLEDSASSDGHERSVVSVLLKRLSESTSPEQQATSHDLSSITINDSVIAKLPDAGLHDRSLIVLSSSEEEDLPTNSISEGAPIACQARVRGISALSSPSETSVWLIPDSEEEDEMPLRELISATKSRRKLAIDVEDEAVLPFDGTPVRRAANSSRAPKVPAFISPALAQSTSIPSASPAESQSSAPTNYDKYTDKQLQKQLDNFGFKAIKQRTAMIAMLSRCHAAQQNSLGQCRAFTTSAVTPAKRASPKKASTAVMDLNAVAENAVAGKSAKKTRAPAMSKEERAALKAQQAAERLAQRHCDKVKLAEDKLQRQVQLQADIGTFLTSGVCSEGDAWYAKVLTYEPIVLEDFIQSFVDSSWYRAQPACADGPATVNPLALRDIFDSKGVCCANRARRDGKSRKRL